MRVTLAGTAIAVVLLTTARYRVVADEIRDARAVWEEAIRAKGGRERLHAVRNFISSSNAPFNTRRRDVARHEYIERLYLLPNRFWEYYDFRPGKMGDGGLALDTDQHRVLSPPGRGSAQRLYEDLVYRLRNGQIVYLMETAYVQPELVGAKRGRLNFTAVDIVETRVDSDHVEFFFDRRTHLPRRIVIRESRPVLPEAYLLSDYHIVDGIEMPMTERFGDDGPKATMTYGFNVEFDEAVFSRSGVRFEKNGWMKR